MYRHKEEFIFVEFLNVLLNNIEEHASRQNPIANYYLSDYLIMLYENNEWKREILMIFPDFDWLCHFLR